jgi:hypothetical protein
MTRLVAWSSKDRTRLAGMLNLAVVSAFLALPAAAAGVGMPALRGQPAVDYLKSHGAYESLEKAVAEARYVARAEAPPAGSGRAFRADNPAQRMTSIFDGRDFTARSSTKSDAPWTLSMRPVRVGRGGETQALSAGEVEAKGGRVEITRAFSATGGSQGRLLEWYVNRPSGIEQGFTLPARPAGESGDEPLRLVMDWDGNLVPRLVGGQSVALAREGGSQVLLYDKLEARDDAGRSLVARLEVEGREVSIVVEDAAARYPVTIDPILTRLPS